MCGICGELRFDHQQAGRDVIADMLPQLEKRGPDASGMILDGPLSMGHRRLKIIDLSEKAAQPMVDQQLDCQLVFNGCIYNYPELRKDLKEKGYQFFSEGDTEVLLKAYRHYGLDFVHHLNGMFAFAIWDRKRQKLVIGRDRLGIKPFYYSLDGNRFRFASNTHALLAAGEIDTSIDPVAVHHYLSFHSVVPAPHTIYQGIRKLPPATIAELDLNGNFETKVYWQPDYRRDKVDENRSFEDWKALTLDVLGRAVRRRMIADVPVGVLLSGGLDSSLVVGLLAENGQKDLKTFSIGFEAAGGEKGDEFEYSDIIAQHFKTDHYKLFIQSDEVLKHLPDCIAAQSEPMVSHDNIGFYLLSREVSKHVKVVQSGQGADEVFGGYHWYPPMLKSTQPAADYARVFFDRDHHEMAEVLQSPYLTDDFSTTFVKSWFDSPLAADPATQALRIDSHIMLVDDPVKRVDNMTMSWGLEARVPFLDHELVELAARMPPRMKVDGGGKYVLKEAAREVIPAAVIDRPKGYFPVPALKYISGPYLQRVRDILGAKAAKERGLINPAYIEKLLAAPSDHITPLRGSKLWQIALLEQWLQEKESVRH